MRVLVRLAIASEAAEAGSTTSSHFFCSSKSSPGARGEIAGQLTAARRHSDERLLEKTSIMKLGHPGKLSTKV
jgi:hypothetical protein